MNLTKLNSRTRQDMIPTYFYNCGGFALGTFNWYLPKEWGPWSEISCPEPEMFDEAISTFVQEIEENFKGLVRVDNAQQLPNRFDLIGFRVGVVPVSQCSFWDDMEEDDGYVLDDFHFIRRHDGVWYEKRGARSVSKIDCTRFNTPAEEFDEGVWYRETVEYNSTTVWFVDLRRFDLPHLYQEAFESVADMLEREMSSLFA